MEAEVITEKEESIRVKLLDCDTISQAKLKIMDAIYCGVPVSQRPIPTVSLYPCRPYRPYRTYPYRESLTPIDPIDPIDSIDPVDTLSYTSTVELGYTVLGLVRSNSLLL